MSTIKTPTLYRWIEEYGRSRFVEGLNREDAGGGCHWSSPSRTPGKGQVNVTMAALEAFDIDPDKTMEVLSAIIKERRRATDKG